MNTSNKSLELRTCKVITIVAFVLAIVGCEKQPVETSVKGVFSYNSEFVTEFEYAIKDGVVENVSIGSNPSNLEFSDDYSEVYFSVEAQKGELLLISGDIAKYGVKISVYQGDTSKAFYESQKDNLLCDKHIICAQETGWILVKAKIPTLLLDSYFQVELTRIDESEIDLLEQGAYYVFECSENEYQVCQLEIEKDKKYELLLETIVSQDVFMTDVRTSLIQKEGYEYYFLDELFEAPAIMHSNYAHSVCFTGLDDETLYLCMRGIKGNPRSCGILLKELRSNEKYDEEF